MFGQKTTKIGVFLAFLCISLPAAAVDPKLRFYQYDLAGPAEDPDFPSDIVDVVESHEGFLWLATSRGLARYDGLEFSLFRVSTYPAVLSNNPMQLFVDSRNRLFIASDRGLSIYVDGQFEALVVGQRWATRIHAFAEDDSGTVWLGSDSGLRKYRDNEISPGPDGSEIEQIRALFWHDDKLLVGARGHIYKIGATVEEAISLPQEFSRSRVRDFAYYRDQIWVATRRGVLTLSDQSAIPVPVPQLERVSADRLLRDRDDNLWFINRNQVGRLLPDGELEIPDTSGDTPGYTPELTDIIEDSDGRIWRSSRFLGLLMLQNTDVVRISYTEGLSSPNVTAMAAMDDGPIFVATDRGVSVVDGDDVRTLLDGDYSLSASITALTIDHERQLWIGTESGVRVYSVDREEWVNLPLLESSSLTELAINALQKGVDDRVWAATEDGLYSIGMDDTHLIPETSGVNVESLLLDSKNHLWLGAENGVSRIVEGEFESGLIEYSGEMQWYVSLVESPSGAIVAATPDRGIAIFDGEFWSEYGEADGIPPERLIDIEADGQDLWLFTGSGVFRTALPPTGEQQSPELDVVPVSTTGQYRGAHAVYCCRGRNTSAAVVSDGRVFATTDDGIVRFDLDVSTDAATPPVPYIKSISVDGEPLTFVDGVKHALDKGHSELRVEYSAIQLNRGAQVEFRYRLLGLSNDWVENETARSVQFQNLPPADYRFELQASFLPDQWSTTTVGFEFERVPDFSESKGFAVLVWAAVVGSAMLLIWVWLAAAKQRHQRLEAEIGERTSALSDLNRELQSANSVLRKSSQTDPLTGLVNRRFFDGGKSGDLISEQVSNRGVVMIIDIDYFKRVNDAYGHAAGDEVLCQFASVLRSCVRQSDLVVRWGGEEFIIICRCPNDDAAAMLDRVCNAVREHSFVLSSGNRVNITTSIGCIRYPLWEGESLDDRMPILMELADAALYVVKMSGRDGWACLEGGSVPFEDTQARHMGPKLGQLVDGAHLLWQASRTEIDPSLHDTNTRLRAIRDVSR